MRTTVWDPSRNVNHRDTQTIPHAIIMAKYKHIAYCLQFCHDNNYESLFEGFLYRILKELKPPQWKSLAGLNSSTADGLNGFSILADIVKKYFAGKIRVLWTTWKGENNILKLDTPIIVLIILLVHHIVSLLLYWIKLIQIYARRENMVLKTMILFVTNTEIFIQP